MDQHKETLEAIMGHVQQPPPCPFNYKDIYWWNEYCVTPQHGLDGTCIQQKVYVAYIPWNKVFDCLVREETRLGCSMQIHSERQPSQQLSEKSTME
jgi:hypothetical protein